MHFNSLLKKVKWFMVNMSVFTMSFAPLAYGKEAEKINQKNLEKYLSEFGVGKKTTWGEFWNNSKSYFPGTVYKDLDQFILQNQNKLMPEITVSSLKSTDGYDIPVLQITADGKTQTIQFYGENNRWVKINGLTLTAKDLERPQDAFARLQASNIKIKKEADLYKQNQNLKQVNQSKLNRELAKKYKSDFSRFGGFPRMTPQLWKSLSKNERVEYIIKMRLLWQKARMVLDVNTNKSTLKKYSYIDLLYQAIFENEAHAIESTPGAPTQRLYVPVAGTSVRTQEGRVVQIPYNAQSCVVAGYVGAYVESLNNVNGSNRAGCSVDIAIAAYRNSPSQLTFVSEANDKCRTDRGESFVACNPIIYGFPSGSPACINKLSAEFQMATHFNSSNTASTCDGMSRLSTSENVIPLTGRDYSTIQPREAQLAAIEVDQKKEEFILTKNFLNGVLAQKNQSLKDIFERGDWSIELDNELIRIQSQFEQEIQNAIRSCEAEITGRHESNQKLACDQLHRRWLFTEVFVAKIRDKSCVKPALYVGSYAVGESSLSPEASEKTQLNKQTIDAQGTNLCQCPASEESSTSATVKVSFGQACNSSGVIPTEPPTPCREGDPNCNNVTCDKPQGIAGFDYEKCQCEGKKKLKQEDDGHFECEGSNWLPWVIGGGMLAIVLAMLFRNKKGKNPPVIPEVCSVGKSGVFPNCICSNICPTGAVLNPESCSCDTAVTPPSCPAPLVGVAPACSCPAAPAFCSPPQKMYNMSTCQCVDVPQPVVCPNGQPAPGGELTNCPKCVNGTYTPVGGCPTEGGNGGNNCPQGGCNGGMPGTSQ